MNTPFRLSKYTNHGKGKIWSIVIISATNITELIKKSIPNEQIFTLRPVNCCKMLGYFWEPQPI